MWVLYNYVILLLPWLQICLNKQCIYLFLFTSCTCSDELLVHIQSYTVYIYNIPFRNNKGDQVEHEKLIASYDKSIVHV